jgi:transcriptional regulator with XRE-family HTH domain
MPAAATAMSDFREIVGHNIVLARTERKLSQNRLAQILGIDRRQLSEWERGIREPNHVNLQRIAVALGKPFPWFYEVR